MAIYGSDTLSLGKEELEEIFGAAATDEIESNKIELFFE